MTQQTFKPTKRFIALLACLTGLTAMGIDSVLPIFPEMIEYYQLPEENHNLVQQVVYVYMMGFALFQLLFGILADTFGRKQLLLIGIGIYSLAAISVVFIKEDFNNVLLARFIQGAGLAAPRVLATTIIRDISSGREMSRIMSFVTMIFLAVPAIAPIVGQIMVIVAPWQSVFVMLFVFGLISMLWVQKDLKETLAPENRRPFSFAKIILAVREFLSHRETLIFLIMISVLFGGLMIYIGQAEQILQKDIYKLGKYFPLAFAAVVLGMIMAAVTNANIVMRVGVRRILRVAIALILITDSIFLLAVILGSGNVPLWFFILTLIVHFFSFGLIMPNLNTLALAPYHHIAGTASALIGMITSIIGLTIAQCFSFFYDTTLYSMVIGFSFCAAILCIAYFFLPTEKN